GGCPVSRTNTAYSARVTSHFPKAKDRSETLCCGASSATDSAFEPCVAAQVFSDADEPMVNVPAGITTISGQSGQSRNTFPGFLAAGFCAGSFASAAITVTIPAALSNKSVAIDRARFRLRFICQLLMRCTRIGIVPERLRIFLKSYLDSEETHCFLSALAGTKAVLRTPILG